MTEDTKSGEAEARVVAALALASAGPSTLDPSVPQAIVVPEGASLQLPDLSRWRPAPARKTGVYRPATVAALTAYLEWQQLADATTVWVHPTSGLVSAIIDDNGETPGYGQHRAVLQMSHTPEWTHWAGLDGQLVGQEAFAEHVEAGLEEIVEPDAATVLEIAQSFHATSSATFRQATRLQSGEQKLVYDETIDAKAGPSGDLTVPTVILLALSPFLGEDRYKLTARLRFRLNAGKLTLGYLLDRPDAVIRDALEAIAERLEERFPRVYLGEGPG